MHMHMCRRVLKGYKCRVRAEHTCFALVFTSEAVNKESAHPHTQVKKKKLYGLSNTATLSQAFPGKSMCSIVKGICVLI